MITLALFAVRLVGIFTGSFSGGLLAGDPIQQNRLSWTAYVTQAGVGLGLAKEVASEFDGVRLGDRATLVGPSEKLEEVMLLFSAQSHIMAINIECIGAGFHFHRCPGMEKTID